MRKLLNWYLLAGVLCLRPSYTIGTVEANTATSPTSNVIAKKGDADVLKIIETETWDAASKSWKAGNGEQRWSNERGQESLSPSEVAPPSDWEFDGDWKIVVSGSDSMGWEYVFQYLLPPKRKRVWLRSVKPKAVPAPVNKRRTGPISRLLSDMRDGYNFKGYSLSFYKSLLSLDSIGFAIGLPLTMNFDLWDRNPALPSISSTFGFYFPWTLSAALSASIHVEWLKWFVKTIVSLIPRFLTLLFYRFVLPALWTAATTALLPLGLRTPPLPETPYMAISKPQYKSGISERIGCSLSYRWSKQRGFEWRFNYWHSYMPTFTAFRKFLQMEPPADWWDKHFGSFGLSTGYPLPLPPHYSCSACLGLSGLYPSSFKARSALNDESDSQTSVSVSNALRDVASNETEEVQNNAQPEVQQQPELIKARSARLVAGSKAA